MPRGAPRLRASDGKKNQVGARVKQRRSELDLTQEDLSGRLALVTEGMWNPALQEVLHIEKGIRTVTDVEVLALASALGCGACWLLRGGDDRRS
jgi:transcriptional regulator with XRE-family HTH domain